MEHVKNIREQVASGQYRVDASAVAEAIVRRLLTPDPAAPAKA